MWRVRHREAHLWIVLHLPPPRDYLVTSRNCSLCDNLEKGVFTGREPLADWELHFCDPQSVGEHARVPVGGAGVTSVAWAWPALRRVTNGIWLQLSPTRIALGFPTVTFADLVLLTVQVPVTSHLDKWAKPGLNGLGRDPLPQDKNVPVHTTREQSRQTNTVRWRQND